MIRIGSVLKKFPAPTSLSQQLHGDGTGGKPSCMIPTNTKTQLFAPLGSLYPPLHLSPLHISLLGSFPTSIPLFLFFSKGFQEPLLGTYGASVCVCRGIFTSQRPVYTPVGRRKGERSLGRDQACQSHCFLLLSSLVIE